jgi:hypothetical protein
MHIKYKYSVRLDASNLKLIRHPKKDLFVKANELVKESYSNLFPKVQKSDILYLSAVSFTVGHINKNDALILPEELGLYKTAVSTPVDIEHNRDEIVGFCLSTYLSNIRNNKILDEESANEILSNDGKVNAGVIFGIWKINNPDLAEMLEDNFDENSSNFARFKMSFECYFDDFVLFLSNGKADFPNGIIVKPEDPDFSAMFSSLLINGGNGMFNGNRVSICPINGIIGGNALTFSPANEFSDLTSIKDSEDNKTDVKLFIDNKEVSKSVNTNTGETMHKDLELIINTETSGKTDAAIVELSVDKDMSDALKTQLSQKLDELNARDDKIKDLETRFATLEATIENYKVEVAKHVELTNKASDMANKLQAQLDIEIEARKSLEAKEKERIEKEILAIRMSKIAEFIELDSELNSTLEKEFVGCSEEDFNKKLGFYKELTAKRNVIVASEVNDDVKLTVEKVIAETVKETPSVNLFIAVPSETLTEKFAKAFNNTKAFGFTDKKLN